ncbi:GFA family protein [Phenylobacterium sp.]|uniref:GFA family protein n=1 Tax=Phenylobacterium sp. TaxID=1871053 RepID=UPI0025CCBA8F|nr:GFA family protein [Phenylobacterium sp.]
MSEARDGGCRCGRVRFAISGPELLTMACHCTGCQRMTGSAFSLTVVVPEAGFAVTAGEPVAGGALRRDDGGHFHCPYCMSWVFTRPGFGIVNVRATMLDDTAGFTPFAETYVSEKLAWVTTPAVHSYERFPPNESFPQLIADYAAAREAG